MANEWTTEYPTQPGYYWIRNYVFWCKDFSGPDLVSLESDVSGLKVCFTGDEDGYALFKFTSAEWYGPIQPPQENDKMTEREFLREFSLWMEIGGLVEENPSRTEQDWEDQIDSFLKEHHIQPPQEN